MKSTETEFYTPDDLAKRYNLPLKSVRVHAYERRIPGAVKIGGAWRFRKSEIHKRELAGELLLPKR